MLVSHKTRSPSVPRDAARSPEGEIATSFTQPGDTMRAGLRRPRVPASSTWSLPSRPPTSTVAPSVDQAMLTASSPARSVDISSSAVTALSTATPVAEPTSARVPSGDKAAKLAVSGSRRTCALVLRAVTCRVRRSTTARSFVPT